MVLEIIQQYPKASIIIMGLVISFLVQLVNYFVLDKERLREVKAKQKSLQDEIKKHRDNPQKMMELNKEMMSHSMEMMRHSFKPMLITLVPLLFIFAFMRSEFVATPIAKSWLWYYIGASIVGSIIFRKMLKLP
ncbi:DUF106 domain-containing protein [Candidatus Pacearchaeota archaeon]|nr:DUF106 domain-containing protein [Candidatus Pacearchaeota archaeon]